MNCFIVLSLIFLSFLSFSSCEFARTVYTAELTGEQVYPIQGGDFYATGIAICTYNRNIEPFSVTCELQHNVTQATGVFVSVAPRSSVGAVLWTWTFANNMIPKYSQQTFIFQNDDQQNDFLNGLWYFTVTSLEYGDGEIRGQIEHNSRFYSSLNAANTIPAAIGTTATGLAIGEYSKTLPKQTLEMRMVHDVVEVSNIELRVGAATKVGERIYTFSKKQSPVSDHLRLGENEENEFFQDLFYFNLPSEDNPSGDIRGQVITTDYFYGAAFTTYMDGDSVIPDANTASTGVAVVSYHCDTNLMEYFIMHNVDDAVAAFAFEGGPNTNGPIQFSLDNFRSPTYGSHVLNEEQEYALYTEQLYLSIISNQFPNGEIRGTLTSFDYDFYAYLTGSEIIPPVSTASVGLGLFKVVPSNPAAPNNGFRALEFYVMHNIESTNALIGQIRGGFEGENGDLVLQFNQQVFSPFNGQFDVDDDDLQALVDDQLYLTILTDTHPLGEIRGNIKRIKPCDANTKTFTVEGDYSTYDVFTGFYPYQDNGDDDDNDQFNGQFIEGEENNASTLSISLLTLSITLVCLLILQ